MKPVVDRLRKEGFKVSLIDAGRQRERAMSAGVRRLPTSIYRVNGEEVDRVSGRMTDWAMRDLCRGL